jgi:hypothetical protein
LSDPLTDTEKLRALRAVELLGWLQTPAAAEVLQTLARGSEGADVTRQAHGTRG